MKTCVICHEEFELMPGKPGFANRCPNCSEPEANAGHTAGSSGERESSKEINAARRKAIRDLLYKKDS